MAVDITQSGDTCKLVATVMNSTPNDFGDFTTDVDPLHPVAEIVAGVKDSAYSVGLLIVNSQGLAARAGFLALTNVTNGQEMNFPFGAILIDGKPGKEIKQAAKFRRYQANINNLTTITGAGYYIIQGHILSFIGSSAQAEKIVPPNADYSLIVPDEYQPIVVSKALALLFPKQGAYTAAAEHFRARTQMMFELLNKGITDFPADTPFGQKL